MTTTLCISGRSWPAKVVGGLLGLAIVLSTSHAVGQSSKFLEVTFKTPGAGEKTLQGKLCANDKHFVWLMERDGRQELVPMAGVTKFREIPGRFRPFNSSELRDRLQREFGKGYEIVATGHYLVCSATGHAREYGETFETIYRQFTSYFSARGFRMKEPEVPLIAIVFPDRASFAQYCAIESISPREGLMGYYLGTSNRVALYSDANAGLTGRAVHDTIIHETTHQVAFNTGVHPRLGQTPTWVVEGLATAFEVEALRLNRGDSSIAEKLNRDRYIWFKNYLANRRVKRSLSDFIGGDRLFQDATLDAYSEAWALTFFLMQTRGTAYSTYLKGLASRHPFDDYSQEQRIIDFKAAFGKDLNYIENEYVRFWETN